MSHCSLTGLECQRLGFLCFLFSLSLFLMWTIFKVFIEFVTILLLLFMFWFFGHKACEILVSQSGIKPTPLALEGESPNHWITREIPEVGVSTEYFLFAKLQKKPRFFFFLQYINLYPAFMQIASLPEFHFFSYLLIKLLLSAHPALHFENARLSEFTVCRTGKHSWDKGFLGLLGMHKERASS